MIWRKEKNLQRKIMKVFRKIFLFILVAVFIYGFGKIMFEKSQPQIRDYIPVAKPCRTPLKYSIGSVDPRFNISTEKLKEILSAAENLWEKNSGLNLFDYDPTAELKVQFTYDERQQQTLEADQIETILNNLDEQRIGLDKQQSMLSKEYDKEFSLFKKAVDEYKKRLGEYNKNVSLWNSQTGTSEKEYAKLKKEEQALKEEMNGLGKKESDLNALAAKANTVIDQEKKVINTYNSAAITYKSKFGNAQEFEKGIFDPDAGITIYQFKEIADLELTLEHELGHALGIGHVENPKSIMYYLIGEQNLDNPELTSEDMAALKNTCQL